MDYKGIYKFLNPCPSVKKIEIDDEAHLKKYIMWENKSNICWLDASMALVAHNKVMKRYSVVHPASKISRIISCYDEAIGILNNSDKSMNQKLNTARAMLNYIQESTLQYLQPILKYKTGDPESAFCSLYNLLIQDPHIKRIFDVTWISVKECTDCGHYSQSTKIKPIVTLSNIDSFDPENLAVIYRCTCNKSQQTIKVVYVSLPPCLIFHFENGAGKEKPALNFTTRGREYYLTSIMTLEKSQDSTVNHFITWVRDVSVNKWLDCNDLNLDIISFSPDFPDIDFKDVYMYVYESFDDLGTITDAKLVKTKQSEENILCIDLSGESDSESSNLQTTTTTSNEDTRKIKTTLESDLKSFNNEIILPELNSNASLKKSLSTDNKNSHISLNEKQIKAIEANENKVQDNIKADKTEVSKTLNISPDINLTSTDGKSTKEINENISISDFSECSDKTTTKINANSCLILSTKETLKECSVSSISTSSHENLEVNSRKAAESEVSFQYEPKENSSLNTTENNQNKDPTSKDVCSNTSDRKPANPKSVKLIKLKDLIKIKDCDKTNVKNYDDFMMKSEQVSTNSNAEQHNVERLVINSTSEREIHREQFLSDATANSSGTSYVKLSVRRKKYPSSLTRNISGNDTNNSNSGETFHNVVADIPHFSKSLKRNSVDEDSVSSEIPVKKKKLSNVKMDTINTKGKGLYSKSQEKDVKNTLTKKSRVKSKLNYFESKRTMHDSSLNTITQERHVNDHHTLKDFQTGTVTEAKYSNINSGNEVQVLKDFEDVWSCHKSGCNCDCVDLEETIDIVVDYTFAYICKLGKEYKKSNIQ